MRIKSITANMVCSSGWLPCWCCYKRNLFCVDFLHFVCTKTLNKTMIQQGSNYANVKYRFFVHVFQNMNYLTWLCPGITLHLHTMSSVGRDSRHIVKLRRVMLLIGCTKYIQVLLFPGFYFHTAELCSERVP